MKRVGTAGITIGTAWALSTAVLLSATGSAGAEPARASAEPARTVPDGLRPDPVRRDAAHPAPAHAVPAQVGTVPKPAGPPAIGTGVAPQTGTALQGVAPRFASPAAQPTAAPAAPPPAAAGPAGTGAKGPASSVTAETGIGPAPANAALAVPAAIPEPVKLSEDPRPSFGPGTFVATMNAAERYRALGEGGGWETVGPDATRLKAGDRGPVVSALRRRLGVEGDLPADGAGGETFDDALGAALRRFQLRHGLAETGLVGPRTLADLNVPVATRIRQLQASAHRMLGGTFPFGERYVSVNIPSATVEAVGGGTVARRYVAVVGKTDRPSPTIKAQIQSINLNPTWTVPVSLIRRDIIPHMRKDPGYLAHMRIRVLDAAGQEIEPTRIDWAGESAVNYTLRQDPGPENSLGAVRINMPNKLAVYMHDTPAKKLFARTSRLQSSGCVRVSDVRDLARWLLEGTAGPSGTNWSAAEFDGAIATGERQELRLVRAVPVAWIYMTGYATPDGAVHFRDDVYGLDSVADEGAGDLGTSSIRPRG